MRLSLGFTKKNELLEKKLKLQEEISQTRLNGSSWLEPMREFINVGKDSQRIARAKNNPEELAAFGKNIGSNFFLTDRHLSANYKKGFDTLFSELGPGRRTRGQLAHSLCERVSGVEPPSLPWEGNVKPFNYTRT